MVTIEEIFKEPYKTNKFYKLVAVNTTSLKIAYFPKLTNVFVAE